MSIVKSLQEALNTEEEVIFEAKDGSNIHITPEHAYSLVSVHDNLERDNQVKMRELLEESEEDFIKVLSFCEKQFNEED
mgnify:CR=1 FL=1